MLRALTAGTLLFAGGIQGPGTIIWMRREKQMGERTEACTYLASVADQCVRVHLFDLRLLHLGCTGASAVVQADAVLTLSTTWRALWLMKQTLRKEAGGRGRRFCPGDSLFHTGSMVVASAADAASAYLRHLLLDPSADSEDFC